MTAVKQPPNRSRYAHQAIRNRSAPDFLRGFRWWLLACLGATAAAVLGACCPSPPIISDIRDLPQDAYLTFESDQGKRVLLSPGAQAVLDPQFNQVFFAPWHRDRPVHDKGELLERLEKFGVNLGYGENRQPHDRHWLEHLQHVAALDTFPNAGCAGITTVASDLRELPSHKPHFNDFELPGEGYPFDNLQYSAIPANTPVFVSHLSVDGSWTLVESHFGLGWVRSSDIARVDAAFIRRWETGRYAAIIQDDHAVIDDGGQFLFKVGLGQILPLLSQTNDSYRVMAAVADENRCARIREVSLPLQAGVLKPMTVTMNHMAAVINQIIGQPYGWGGLYGNRDCSSTLKDLFVPFGVWLPRNSFHQAHKVGRMVSLEGLSAPDKMKKISGEGFPFLTLLWSKGHIALYLGDYTGRPLVFHNFWGIRTRDAWGREGRQVVGHAAITSVHPGAELCRFDRMHSDLLNRIEAMTLLAAPDTGLE
jgi:cell wall-associated NlpC family hydrolase